MKITRAETAAATDGHVVHRHVEIYLRMEDGAWTIDPQSQVGELHADWDGDPREQCECDEPLACALAARASERVKSPTLREMHALMGAVLLARDVAAAHAEAITVHMFLAEEAAYAEAEERADLCADPYYLGTAPRVISYAAGDACSWCLMEVVMHEVHDEPVGLRDFHRRTYVDGVGRTIGFFFDEPRGLGALPN